MLSVDLLGPIEVRRDGERLSLPAGKTSELLVRLALDAERQVRTEVLLEDLWDGCARRNTLQSKISQLRRALGDRDAVVATGDGYVLTVDRRRVDAHAALALADQAAAALTAADSDTALSTSTHALEMFRGEVLIEQRDWAAPHRTRLEEVRLGLVETAMAARVNLGAGGELVATLEELVSRHPLREALWGTLITALYRAGRQAEALDAYARIRRLLVEELGVEPGPGLRDIEKQVLEHSRTLEPARRDSLASVPGNLPVELVELVGRAPDLRNAAAVVGRHRLVSIVGAAGVGKTALALTVAQHAIAPGGVWVVRLEAVDASADLRRVVAETLHVPAEAPALEQRLAGARTVLVLDNCEHLVGEVAALAEALLEAVPSLGLLVTSQVPLGIDHERVLHLKPLTGSDAIVLFERRAKQMRSHFSLDAETTALVLHLCRALDGLPLAIELTAARVRSMSVRDIARRLDDRFALVRDPSSHRPERRRALAGAIGWSYDLLFPDDQRGLQTLSVFAGSACLDAVEAVVAQLGIPAGAVVDILTRLVDRNLAEVDATPEGGVRYRLLDSIRAFASDRLRREGATETLRAAHARWYAEGATWCDDNVRSAHQPACLAFARAERSNIDAALTWSRINDPVLGMEIAGGMGWTWVVLGDGTSGAARVRDAITDAAPSTRRLGGYLLAAWLEASAGDLTLAQADLDQARAIAAGLSDELSMADVDRHQAFVAIQQGHPDVVLGKACASLSVYRRLGRDWHTAGSLVLAAYGAMLTGDTSTATRDGNAAVVLLARVPDPWVLVHAQALLGVVAQAEHRLDDAATALRQAAETSRALGFPGQAALHLSSLAEVERQQGHDARAVRTFRGAIAHARAGGDGRLAATARLNLVRLLRSRGADPEAQLLLEENQRWYDDAGGGEGALLSRCLLHAETGNQDCLLIDLHEAVNQGNAEVRVYALDALARCAAQQDRLHDARALLAEADAAFSDAPRVTARERYDRRQAQALIQG